MSGMLDILDKIKMTNKFLKLGIKNITIQLKMMPRVSAFKSGFREMVFAANDSLRGHPTDATQPSMIFH